MQLKAAYGTKIHHTTVVIGNAMEQVLSRIPSTHTKCALPFLAVHSAVVSKVSN